MEWCNFKEDMEHLAGQHGECAEEDLNTLYEWTSTLELLRADHVVADLEVEMFMPE
jgi:hypothetical protein